MAKKPTTSEILDQIKRDMFKDVMKPVEMLTLDELMEEFRKRCTSMVIAYEAVGKDRQYFQDIGMAGSPMACRGLIRMVSTCIDTNDRREYEGEEQ